MSEGSAKNVIGWMKKYGSEEWRKKYRLMIGSDYYPDVILWMWRDTLTPKAKVSSTVTHCNYTQVLWNLQLQSGLKHNLGNFWWYR